MTAVAGAGGRNTRRRIAAEGMPLRAHLAELRKRLLIAVAAVFVGAVVAFLLTEPIISLLTEPINMIAADRGSAVLNFDSVTAAFDLRMRISLTVGLVIAAPVWLAQLWLFLVPALTRREKRFAVGFLAAAIPLFFGGCSVGLIITPHAIEIMSSFVPEGAAQFFQYSYYYDFVLKLVVVVGIAFVLPVFLVLMNLVGLVSAADIVRGWRVAIIVSTLFAAVATPAADVVSMLLLAGILVVLYFAAAGVAYLFDRRRSRAMKNDQL